MLSLSETLHDQRSSPEPDQASYEYSLLTSHNRTDGSFKSTDALQMEYINLTDNLIYKMTDGLDVINPDTHEREKRIPDVVIFLDKSARPLAWLTKELWERLATDPETHATPAMPDLKFLNIDREQWINVVDPQGVGRVDVDKVDPGIIRSLRSIFVSPLKKQEGLTEDIDTTPASLDGKTVMVVDEVYSTGRTLNIATQLVRRAFPDAYVGGAYWMQGTTTRSGATGNADLPVWYRDDTVFGRGVGDRNPIVAQDSDKKKTNITQRLGSWFLSTRFTTPDLAALRLREEIHELATHPTVPIRPSNDRDDAMERLEALNGKPAREVLKDIGDILGRKTGR